MTTRRPVQSDTRTVLPQGTLIEFIAQGSYVKVSAVDPITFVEVSIVGPPQVGKRLLTQQAVRKLERMDYRHKYAKGAPSRCAKRQKMPSGWDF